MKKHVLIFIFSLLICYLCEAQKTDPNYQTVEKFVEEYIQLSRLGPGYSREISQEIIDQFNALFEKDAFLYWDLYRSAADSLLPPLSVNEYVDRAKKLYHLEQPILDYSGAKIRVQKDGQHALIFLKKINLVVNGGEKPLWQNQVNLRVELNLNKDRPLIQNVFEDKRISPVRSLSVGIDFLSWSNVINTLVYHPDIRVGANEHYKGVKITTERSFQFGGLLEIKINKETRDGLTFSTGLFYSQVPLSSSITDYSKNFPDTLDKASGNAFTCTTFERSPEVWEKITIKKIEIPLLFKSYLNDWVYLKSGTCLSYITGTSDVNYILSKTGGGLVTNFKSNDSYYLDKDNELDQSNYGYFRNKKYSFSKERIVNKMILSIHLAVGFEKQVNYFSFGLEPNVSFGMNPLSKKSLPGNYRLNNIKGFTSILESAKMPAFEFAFGVRLLISYVFKN